MPETDRELVLRPEAGTLHREGPMKPYSPPPPPTTWEAQWIWHRPLEYMDNFHLLARRELALEAAPAQARLWVSANNFYLVYVNGQLLGRGPSPSFPEWQYFDCYEVAPFLRAGVNVLAVRCYNFGPTMESVLRQDPGPGGLLLQLEVDGEPVVVTDGAWRVLQDPSREQRTEPLSGHRGGFKEVCDARREVLGWDQVGFDDSAWPAAQVLGPVGTAPWRHLIPREIPPLRRERVLPQEVYFHCGGRSYGGASYDVSAPEALRQDDDSCALVQPLGPDFAPSILLDFGQEVYGYFEVEIAESAGGAMELSFGESLNLTLIDRLTLRPGAQTYGPIERRGGRYLQLTFRDCSGPVAVRRVVCQRQSYPVEPAGDFRCSDARLNRIWEVGRYTVQMCLQDHYEDCPWREQSLYGGDLAVGALLSYYAFGVQDLARKVLRQLARTQHADGHIFSLGPAPGLDWIIPEFPAFWILSLADYYRHWGDLDLVRELFPALRRLLAWYDSHTDEQGLFVRTEGQNFGPFVDNLSNIQAQSQLAAEDLIISEAYRRAGDLARELGEGESAAAWQAAATVRKVAVESAFWREECGCLIDSLEPGGDTVTQITNGLALLYDAVAPARRASLARVLLDRSLAPAMRAGYMNFYMVEALAHAGRHHEAVERIREYWGGMLDRGATTCWETFDPASPPGTIPPRLWSLCHGFCSGPVYLLPAQVGGIRALAPGCARVEVAPRPGELDWVRATVPTPRGTVRVTCLQERATRTVDLEVCLPAETAAEVLMPLPGRDLWTVLLGGRPVPVTETAAALREVHPDLELVRVEADGVRLCFGAAGSPRRLALRTLAGAAR